MAGLGRHQWINCYIQKNTVEHACIRMLHHAVSDRYVLVARLLMQGAGYEEVRVVASSMLEGYLNNPVHLRAAKALLDRILHHTRSSSDNDLNTVANLFALRITTLQPPGQVCKTF